MFNKILNRRRALFGAGVLLALGASAQTGSWPDRPIRLIVPGPAAGGIDIFALAAYAAMIRSYVDNVLMGTFMGFPIDVRVSSPLVAQGI